MISRKSAERIADLYCEVFGVVEYSHGIVDVDALFDFLFKNDIPAWLCNAVKKTRSHISTRPTKDYIMRLHTGESVINGTQNWTWQQRINLGQQCLIELAEDMINYYHGGMKRYHKEKYGDHVVSLERILELDGYIYQDGKLLLPEEDILDVEQSHGVLESLLTRIGLKNRKIALHHLNLSEVHYIDSKWDDSISNSRKFFESVLLGVASKHSVEFHKIKLSKSKVESAKAIRQYLLDNEVIDKKECDTIAKVYGLLSAKGGHPFMAEKDQTRLLRHLVLTFSQFVMLRLEGAFKTKTE